MKISDNGQVNKSRRWSLSAAVAGVEGFPAAAIYNPAQLDNLKQSQQQHTSTNTDPCKNDTNTNTNSCIYDFAQLDNLKQSQQQHTNTKMYV